MTEVYIYGIKLRYVTDFIDKILPEDHNDMVKILWNIYYELVNIYNQLKR